MKIIGAALVATIILAFAVAWLNMVADLCADTIHHGKAIFWIGFIILIIGLILLSSPT